MPRLKTRLGSRLRRLVQGLSTKPGGGAPDSDAGHKGSVVGPTDMQETRRGHDPDDGHEVLFLCCYFARTIRHD